MQAHSVVDMVRQHSRLPHIVADAAYVIVSQPSKQYTGNFCIDEQLLAYQGMASFDQYSTTPGATKFTEGTEDLVSAVILCRWLY